MQNNTDRLEGFIAGLGSVVVGFSGGVDSTVVAVAATRALGKRALIVTADTETLPRQDLALTADLAAEFEMYHRVIRYRELELDGYAANGVDRCYHCKNGLYDHLSRIATEGGFQHVLDGSQLDDRDDYRPGRRAALEAEVVSPLMELEIDKAGVREIAIRYGLPNHDKPAAPCLSSRIPFGTPVTRQRLEQIEAAEREMMKYGFRQLRVRHHEDIARLEVAPEDLPGAVENAENIVEDLRRCGYRYVTLDLAGFQSGSLNPQPVQISLGEERS